MDNKDTTKPKDNGAILEQPNLTPEQQAALNAERQRQEALLKSVKTKEQIAKEMEERLKAASGSKGVAVAAALMSTIPTTSKQEPSSPKIIRKFEVTLYEEDEDERGQIVQKIVNGGKPEIIEATSLADLNEKLSLYKQCGQIPKVKEVGVPMMLNPDGSRSPYEAQNAQTSSSPVVPQQVKTVEQKRPPKFYKIGGIEVKDDNGKIYQKQWMKLSDAEAKNIRIVNDKTNSIVNLSGKHFEMLKWILVENSESDDVTSMEENLNG